MTELSERPRRIAQSLPRILLRLTCPHSQYLLSSLICPSTFQFSFPPLALLPWPRFALAIPQHSSIASIIISILHLSNSRTPSTFVHIFARIDIKSFLFYRTRILYSNSLIFYGYFIPWTLLFSGFFFVCYVRSDFSMVCFVGLGFCCYDLFGCRFFVGRVSFRTILRIWIILHSIVWFALLPDLLLSRFSACKRILQQLSWIQQVFLNNSSIAKFVRILHFDWFDYFSMQHTIRKHK